MTDFSLPSVSLVRSQLESVLLVVDAPVSVSALAVGLAVSEDVVVGELLELRRELDERGRGFELRETEAGSPWPPPRPPVGGGVVRGAAGVGWAG